MEAKGANGTQVAAKRKIPWLLQTVLENLGVSTFKHAVSTRSYSRDSQGTIFTFAKLDLQRSNQPSASVQVRHQSLQVLLTMSSHFDWIKSHLVMIADALRNSMKDEVTTVRQRSARCMDIVAHSTSNSLLNQSANKSPDFDENVDMAISFWTEILRSITEQLQSEDIEGVTKSVYCDALSDIGVCVYERLPVIYHKHSKEVGVK